MSDNIIKLVVGSDEFKFWSSIQITRNIDTFDTFSFDAPYGDDSLIKDIIKPLEFKPGELFIDDELLSTIVLLDPIPTIGVDNSITVTGYGKPGVLNDCNIKQTDYPIEFNDQTLEQIAKEIAGLFDIDVEFGGSPLSIGSFPAPVSGAPFEKVKLEIDWNPFNFLIKLAKLRGYLISNTKKGKLLFWKAGSSFLSTTLKQGHTPLLSVTPNIKPQGYYSEITGLPPGSTKKEPELATVKNSNLSVNRPHVYRIDQHLSGADLQDAVKWKMGLMIGNAIGYTINVEGLRDERGQVWEPNTFINLTAPGAYVNNETTFVIKNLTLNKGGSEMTSMDLVLPESYSGEIPSRLPWD